MHAFGTNTMQIRNQNAAGHKCASIVVNYCLIVWNDLNFMAVEKLKYPQCYNKLTNQPYACMTNLIS